VRLRNPDEGILMCVANIVSALAPIAKYGSVAFESSFSSKNDRIIQPSNYRQFVNLLKFLL
jgi:hypothetical protein